MSVNVGILKGPAPRTVTIASGGDASDGIYVPEGALLVVATPSNLQGVASISFEVTYDNGATWLPLHKDGSAISVTLATSTAFTLPPSDMYGANFYRIKTNTTTSGDLALTLVHGPVK